MKKNIIYLILMFCFFSSCSDDVKVFDVDVQKDNLIFEAIPGGAILHYSLPKNENLEAIEVRYKDEKGKEIRTSGSCFSNQLKLTGFINANDNLKAEVYYIDKSENYSQSFTAEYSVLDCSAKSFFKNLEVKPFWNGVHISYVGSEKSTGMVHVGYLGINDMTEKIDTILLTSQPIFEGEQSFGLMDIADKETGMTTAVIWTEDAYGDKVTTKVFKDIKALKDMKFDNSNFELIQGSSLENDFMDNYKPYISSKYLFNHDLKGILRIETTEIDNRIFASEQGAIPGYWTVDIKEAKVISRVRFYAALSTTYYYSSYIFNFGDCRGLPRHLKIYVSNDPNLPEDEWKEVAEYFEPASTAEMDRWFYKATRVFMQYSNLDEIRAVDPVYLEVNLDFLAEKYRYIRFEVLNTYEDKDEYGYANDEKILSFQEFEVFVKDENQ